MTMRVLLRGPRYDSARGARPRRRRRSRDVSSALPGADAATVTDLVPLDDQGGSDAPADGRRTRVRSRTRADGALRGCRGPLARDVRSSAWSRAATFTEHELSSDAAVALVNARLARRRSGPARIRSAGGFELADDAVEPVAHRDRRRPGHPHGEARRERRDAADRVSAAPVRSPRATTASSCARAPHPESVIAGVRAAVHAVDPSLALFDVYPMEQVRWLSYWMYVMWGTMFGVVRRRSRSSSPRSASTASSSTRCRSARARSACASRSARAARRSSGPMLRQVALLCLRRHRDRSRRLAGRHAGRRQPADRRVAARSRGTGDRVGSSWHRRARWRRGCRRGARRPSIPRSRSATNELRTVSLTAS